ncbi:uncharacterized protein LOC135144579 [Zophobas morio]|uniref:uncharacterized protein LOC135144579 n=1 Tax=Zophobas morio TaxID=2755281 RepID=UPI0030831C10
MYIRSPKIHKNNCPIRPIVSTLESPTNNTAQYLARVLKAYTGQTSSHILNSSLFVQLISEISLDPKDRIVSFDVTTSTSWRSRRKMSNLHILTSQGQFYKQISDTPMGSPLSPVRPTQTQSLVPLHGRHMCHMASWSNALSVFHDLFNSQHLDIQFTMEVETNNCLPFLDVMVTMLPDGQLGHSVYRKPTHTDRFLDTTSQHYPAQKRSVIDSLIHRATTICQPNKLQKELEHLQTSLQQNGYDHHSIKSAIQRRLNPNSDNTSNRPTDFVSTAYLPFIPQVTDRLSKIL